MCSKNLRVFFLFLSFTYFLFYVHQCFACMYVCEGIRAPGTGVTDSCELPYGGWELNRGPLEKQPVLLTAEPSLQLQRQSFLETSGDFKFGVLDA